MILNQQDKHNIAIEWVSIRVFVPTGAYVFRSILINHGKISNNNNKHFHKIRILSILNEIIVHHVYYQLKWYTFKLLSEHITRKKKSAAFLIVISYTDIYENLICLSIDKIIQDVIYIRKKVNWL